MSDFVSVYDVVFGTRPPDVQEIKAGTGNFEMSISCRPDEQPVDIARVVCAIEDENCKSYSYDQFGRFGIAKKEAKDKVKAALASFHKVLPSRDPDEVFETDKEYLSDFNDAPDWHFFGWLLDDLPDFEACYDQWKASNGMEGKQAPSIKKPAVQSHIWGLMNELLKHAIGEDAYKDVSKLDYKKARAALAKYGFGGDASQDKNLRINLKTIVDRGQL